MSASDRPILPGSAPPLLVGREREMDILRQHLHAAFEGRGNLVLIGGEAGAGKTSLAEAICREATERGAMVLVGRCFDLTETPAYGPLLYCFERYRPDGNLPPPPSAFAVPGVIGAVTSQAALHRQVLDFFEVLTEQRPAVLLLEDLHWSDPASLDFLRSLAHSVADLRLLVLATYRVDELTRKHPLYQLLPLLVRESRAARIDLRPLDAEAVRALVDALYRLPEADTDRLVSFLQARAEGNGLFLAETLRSVEEDGTLRHTGEGWALGPLDDVAVPPLLHQVIDARVSRLGDESQRLLAVAAVVGQEVPYAVWAAVAGVDEARLLDVIVEVDAAHVMAENRDGTGAVFAHALLREALYEEVLPSRRRSLHRRTGEALVAQPRPDTDAIASHFQCAGDARASEWLVRAGERAQAAYAWVTAAARFEVALALMEQGNVDARERGWLHLRLSRLLRYANTDRACACADEAYALGDAAGDPLLAAYARFQSGLIRCSAGDVARGLQELEDGTATLAMLPDSQHTALAHRIAALVAAPQTLDVRGTVVLWRANTGHLHQACELGERLLAEPGGDETGGQRMRDGYFGLGVAYAARGLPDRAAAMFTLAHEACLRAGHHAIAGNTLGRELELVALPYQADDCEGRQRLAERSEAAFIQASGVFPADVPPRFWHLPLYMVDGRWDDAERLAMSASTEQRGVIGFRAMGLRYLATLARRRGDVERAWRAVRSWLPHGDATEPGSVAYFDVALGIQQVAVELALDTGDLTAAAAWLTAHDRCLAWTEAVRGQSEGAALWARYYRQRGESEAANEHAEQALVLAIEPRQPLALLQAHRLLGELDTDARRYNDAARHLDTALELADACQAPYEQGLTLLAIAELRAASGETEAARQLLDKVRATGEPLGAKPMLARAAALVARLAATHTATPSFPAGLSAREVEVLRLVAEGLSNPQVGERLFLSPRTVEQHLRSIFNKTGVPSRTAAARWAAEHGLV